MPAPTSPADRALAVSLVDGHLAEGKSIAEACSLAGLNRANYYRWKAEPKDKTEPKKVGRKAVLELTQMEVSRLRFWRLTRGSVPLALAEFANDELCRPEVGQWILSRWTAAVNQHRRPSWPLSVRRALYVTAAEEGMYRGEKAYDETVVTERRGNFWRDEDGREWPMTPNSIFESDDESENQPFRYFDPAAGREVLGRQSLKTISAHSLKWLGFTHVGRRKDAYRVEDIADHFTDIVRTCGLPLLWRVERGVWNNNWLFGIELEDGSRWGGLDTLFHIRQKFRSRGKANVEGSFNHAQDIRAHGPNGGVTSIGRCRGEFEMSTKEFLSAQRGDVEDLSKFWSIAESADATAKALARFNAEPKERHIFGGRFISPDEAYGTPEKREVPADQWWRFLPVKKQISVRRGVVEINAPHYPVSFRFRVNGVASLNGLHLDNGHKLLVAFHPGHPEQGLHLFNAEEGPKNREGFGFAQFLGLAEYMPDRPQEDLSGQGDFSAAKMERAGVRREFRQIVAGTARGARKSHAQDSLGNVLRQAQGAGMAPAAAPAKTTRGGVIIPQSVADRLKATAEVTPPSRQTSLPSEVAQASRLISEPAAPASEPPRLSRSQTLDLLAEAERRSRGALIL